MKRPLLRGLSALAAAIAPPFYELYMHFVWRTSRLVDHGLTALKPELERRGAAGVSWHEEIFAALYVYRRLGLRGQTLINRSRVGDIVTRIVERCGFYVVRGGSSGPRAAGPWPCAAPCRRCASGRARSSSPSSTAREVPATG